MTASPTEALRKTPLFASLPPEEMRRVAAVAASRRVPRRGVVFREGDPADAFFVVAEGKVKVFKLSEEGKEQVLHIVGPGQSFAEAMIFEGGAYPAAAEAVTDAVLFVLPKRAFLDLLEGSPRLAILMLASLSRWLKRMTDLVEAIALRDVEARFRWFVADEMRAAGIPLKDGAVFDLPVTKNVLASRLGTVAETFSRTLKKLQTEGTIGVRGRQIRILDAGAFRPPPSR